MTLADELMGKRPLVNLSPGRIVSHDDEDYGNEPCCNAAQIIEWAGGEFTSRDVAQVFGVHIKTASAIVGRMWGNGQIKLVRVEKSGGRPLRIWRVVKEREDRPAARKHFGA